MRRFVVLFLVLLIGLFTLELLKPVQQHVVEPFTASLASISASLITPFDDSVKSQGRVLQFGDYGFAVSIEAGCNGVEATIVLIAAILAFPAPWRSRFWAIAIGFVTIQVLNLARIISLFYLGRWNIDIFNWVHLYLWPVLIMLDVLVVFIFYLRHLSNVRADVDQDE